MFLLLSFLSTYAMAANSIAGAVAFATGKPIATNSEGSKRTLARGKNILSGDAIKTGKGLLHIRFTDGSFMSLKPNSQLTLDEYFFNGNDDGSERQILSLVQGGFRTISGVIGKKHRENYRLQTPQATIGIRGTKYHIDVDNGLTLYMGEDGAIIIYAETGTYQITAFEVATLGGKDNLIKILTSQGIDPFTTGDINSVYTEYSEGENRNSVGEPAGVENGLPEEEPFVMSIPEEDDDPMRQFMPEG